MFDNKKCEVWYNSTVILAGTKDHATDLWTLPIPRGKMGTTQESATNKELEIQTLPRPSPVRGRAPQSPPSPAIASYVHTFCDHTSQRRKICASIVMQPKNFEPTESHTPRVLKRVSGHQQNTAPQIFEPQSGDSKGTHETPLAWHQEHPRKSSSTRI